MHDRDYYQPQLFIAETEFDMELCEITKAAKRARTVVFPSTARCVQDSAFRNMPLKSVVLNEHLEELGGFNDKYCHWYKGVFSASQIKQITLPQTLQALGDYTFCSCTQLRQVLFAPRSMLG